MTKNLHVFIVQVLGQTNTMPTRLLLKSELFKQSVRIPFTNEPGSIAPAVESAELWLRQNGFDIIGSAEGKGHNYIITDTFKPITP